MSLNLITDAWIPVRRRDGVRVIIAPWQMADPDLTFPDWPRPDLNIACLELLIGLVFLADPPEDEEDWQDREAPDPDRLRERLAPYAPAFELLGDGPRFLQDLELREEDAKGINPPDMLFIDSAGAQTIKNNADLSVKRSHYPILDQPLAAMALYTLQAFAPSGGAGNRTSMRGGGPMVTLLEPPGGLWPLIWANVPDGEAAKMDDLPWMRPTRTSEKGQEVYPHTAHPVEALFGMPRRLRLVTEGEQITGVIQKPYGANYAGWEHPLTPYYRVKQGTELLPKHPSAGPYGYRNWLGITAKKQRNEDDTARVARVLNLWEYRADDRAIDVIVAGWSMDNMKPRDFLFARAPLVSLSDMMADRMEGMVDAADKLAAQLRIALKPVLAEGQARDAAREEYYIRTQAKFEECLDALRDGKGAEDISRVWLAALRSVALNIFDRHALQGLSERDTRDQEEIIQARRNLTSAFAGYSKVGREAFSALGLPVPEKGKKKGKAV